MMVRLNTSALGVTTGRHTSCTAAEGYEEGNADSTWIEAPVGPCIVRWDIHTGERIRHFQAHQDAVVYMEHGHSHDHDVTISISHAGEVVLWDVDANPLTSHCLTAGDILHAGWCKSEGLVAVNTLKKELFLLKIDVQHESSNEKSRSRFSLTQLLHLKEDSRKFSHSQWCDASGALFVIEETLTDEVSGFAPTPNKVTARLYRPSVVHEDDDAANVDVDGAGAGLVLLDEVELSPEWTLASTVCEQARKRQGATRVAITRTDRSVMVFEIDGDKLELVDSIKLEGKGALRAVLLDGKDVYVPYCARSLANLHLSSTATATATSTRDLDDCECSEMRRPAVTSDGESRQEHQRCVGARIDLPCELSVVTWLSRAGGSKLWVCGDGSLHVVDLRDPKQSKGLTQHEITCCGIEFVGSDGNSVVTGDFAGNVLMWHRDQSHPVMQTKVESPIRSVAWNPSTPTMVQLGCISGELCEWDTVTQQVNTVYDAGSTITSLAWDKTDCHDLLAVGTVAGDVTLHSRSNLLSVPINRWKAHPPSTGPQDLNFGSLNSHAEVWSLTWNPESDKLCTTSEDQTVRVWTKEGQELARMKGHTAAVTCVKWEHTTIGNVIATCADDRTVRLWSAGTYEALTQLSHPNISGWHTFTYLGLEPNGDFLTCATQNGYLLVWSLKTKSLLRCSRAHQGSIEGLTLTVTNADASNGGEGGGGGDDEARPNVVVATCSSDCSVIISTLQSQ